MSNLVEIIIYSLFTFFLAMFVAPYYIHWLKGLKMKKQIRTGASGWWDAKGYQKLHAHKAGTPTMGGGLIIWVVFLMVGASLLLYRYGSYIGVEVNNSLWDRGETYLVFFTLISIGLLGFIDDWLNIRWIGKNKGMSARVKTAWLTLFSLAWAWWFWSKLWYTSLSLPMVEEIEIGAGYVLLFAWIIFAMANAVNITDGLDGLAWGLLLQNFLLYWFITYQEWLFLLSTLCMVIMAALLAFLWFNIKPAEFYMGDIGSLSLWATLWVMAMMTDTLAVLFIISLIYIWEIMSTAIQITSKKLRNGKKVFKIAPFHHHLEALGWKEETIVMKFWVISILLHALGVAIYILLP